MSYADSFNGKKKTKFIGFIEDRGAEVLESNNPYEIIRFKVHGSLNIIYKNKYGELTFSGEEAETAFDRWRNGKGWNPPNKKRQQLTARKLKISKRDGLKCFWCDEYHKSTKTLTVEHILSVKHGGTNNINNLSLACQPCNLKLGSLSITQKIVLRDKLSKKVLDIKA